eukprot:Gb_10778 [translate_table: standard]
MKWTYVNPNQFTLSSALEACAALAVPEQVEHVHSQSLKAGFESDVFVGSALIDAYTECRNVEDAHEVFRIMPKRNLVSWNAMIAGYTQHGCSKEAFQLYRQMHLIHMKPNQSTFSTVLSACIGPEALEQVMQTDAHTIKNGFESDVYVETTLITMYTEGALKLCKQLLCADTSLNRSTFTSVLSACAYSEVMEQGKQIHAHIMKTGLEDSISMGNALVIMYSKRYSQNVYGEQALKFYHQMQWKDMKPDHITFACALGVCATLAALGQGKKLHCHIIKTGLELDVIVGSALVNMSAKCGSIEDACKVFNRIPKQNVVSWTAMIARYAHHRRGNEALQLFEEIQFSGTKPDHVTFVGILLRAAMLSQWMKATTILILRVKIMALIHGNLEMGKHAAQCLLLEPRDSVTCVLLSNIYAMSGRVHAFTMEDRSHPQMEEIYTKLETLTWSMEELGYEPDLNLVLHDVELEQKVRSLSHYREKLAIAFGLISMPLGMSIRVIKKLGICSDCHIVIKSVPKVASQEIIVRDANRFHHLRMGCVLAEIIGDEAKVVNFFIDPVL